MKINKLLFILLVSVLFVFASTTVFASEHIPGTVEGTNTNFTITDSDYLNITLDSTESIDLRMESIPEMVVFNIEADSATSPAPTSTQITLSGFATSTSYYLYEDSFENLTQITTDTSGTYTYTQDLTIPHLIFIQNQPSTKYIRDNASGGDCYLIGTWNNTTKTCTLTQDVLETVQISNNNITIDGANLYSIAGPGTGMGIYVPNLSNITIKNILITSFSYGVYNQNSSITIDNAQIKYNNRGINQNGTSLTLTNSEISNSNWTAVNLFSGTNIVNNNNIHDNYAYGVFAQSNVSSLDLNNNIFLNHQAGKPIYLYAQVSNFTHSNNTATGSPYNGIFIGGSFTTNQTLTSNDLPYIFTKDVYVNSILTLDPGTIIKFVDQARLYVNGTLNAQGTATNKVYFTSLKDDSVGGDTNGDGTGSTAAAGNWNSITLNPGSQVDLDYAVIRYGGYYFCYWGCKGDNTALYNKGGALDLSNVQISNNSNGVLQESGSLNVSFSEVFNHRYGFNISGGTAVVNNNSIHDNGSYGVYASSGINPNVQNNWWGDASGPYHATLNASGTGDAVSAYVTDFVPWLGYDPTQNQAPTFMYIKQLKSDGITELQEGDITNEKTVIFQAIVSDPDNNQAKIEVEVKEIDQPFDGTNILSGNLVNPGQASQATITNLTYGKYKWRIRAIDQNGASTQWQEFGMVGVMDFEAPINIAVILAETSNRTYIASSTPMYYKDIIGENTRDYFCENSFGTRATQTDPCADGTLNFNFEIFADPNNNNQPYKLTQTQEYYGQEGDFTITLTDINDNAIPPSISAKDKTTEFAWDAIKLANPNINYNDFDSVMVLYPGDYIFKSNTSLYNQYLPLSPLALSSTEEVKNLIAVAELRVVGSWAHELGHALGKIVNNSSLCDLYEGSRTCGNIGDWGLMGRGSTLKTNPNDTVGATPSHFSIFSKKRLSLLDFDDSIATSTVYNIESLETMKLNDKAKRYNVSQDSYYIFEPRTTNPQYSRWDVTQKKWNKIPYDHALVIYGVVPSSTPNRLFVDIKSILNPIGSYEDVEHNLTIKTTGAVSDSQSFKIKTEIQPGQSANLEGMIMGSDLALFNQLLDMNLPITEIINKISFISEVKANEFPGPPLDIFSYDDTLTTYEDTLMIKSIMKFLLKNQQNQSDKIKVYTDKTNYQPRDTVKVYVENNSDKPVIVGIFPEGNLFREVRSDWFFMGRHQTKGGVTKIIKSGEKNNIISYTIPKSGSGDFRDYGSFRFAIPYSFDLEKFDKWEDDFRETDPLLPIIASPEFEVDVTYTPLEQPKETPTTPTITKTSKTFTQKLLDTLSDSQKTTQIYLTFLSALLLLISIVLRLNKKISKKYSKLLNILIVIFTITLIFSITKVLAKTDNQTSQTKQDSIAHIDNQTYILSPASADLLQTNSGQTTIKQTETQNNTQSYVLKEIPSDYTPTSPDLDLHAITPDGLHTGINYDTGEYENQIPGAKASGDMMFNNEWIFVPENTQVKYFISSRDIENFLNQNPDIANQLTTTQETYTLSAMYYDSTSQKFESTPLENQPIDPGETITHETTGTTDITVEPGIPDNTPPQTTISLTGTMGNNNYYVSDVAIDFTATDPAPTGQESTGILKTKYSLDQGTTWDVYATSTPLIIDTEGTNTIFYKSIDRANNQEPTQTITLDIDKTAPTIFASDTSAEQITEQGTYLDIEASTQDNIDTNPTLTSDIPLSGTFAPGTTDILLTSQDFAGNIATSTITITIFSTPTADPDGDCVANQDDVKPFDSTIFANIILPQEYSYWEKETFNYPFSIAGVGNVEMSFSDIYFEIEETDPVKDSNNNIIPTTITNVDGITTISFTQNTKENQNYILTIKTKKGNKKEKEKIKKKKDEEHDEEKKDELEKELKFVEAPITVKLTSNTCPNTLEVSSPINIYDKEKKASIHYKYKDDQDTQLILKSDDEIEIQRGQPLVLTVKVTNLPKNTPFSADISGNFTMIDTVIEEEHDDEKNKHRKEKKFSLFYPTSITDPRDTITITLTVGSVTQTDTIVVKFKEEDND